MRATSLNRGKAMRSTSARARIEAMAARSSLRGRWSPSIAALGMATNRTATRALRSASRSLASARRSTATVARALHAHPASGSGPSSSTSRKSCARRRAQTEGAPRNGKGRKGFCVHRVAPRRALVRSSGLGHGAQDAGSRRRNPRGSAGPVRVERGVLFVLVKGPSRGAGPRSRSRARRRSRAKQERAHDVDGGGDERGRVRIVQPPSPVFWGDLDDDDVVGLRQRKHGLSDRVWRRSVVALSRPGQREERVQHAWRSARDDGLEKHERFANDE